MRIIHPTTRAVMQTPCTGCYCHTLPVQFGELVDGCCSACCCPKNQEGWDWWVAHLGGADAR